ncbi:hypothetical protein EHE19_004300 [Ruminiclostridium herbifermentans]|uniref:Peptidase G2 IMC autoproteolytic cleavage domain-containing protein n=2 Tax=Ruminiclostridium herbifermentans TaxID=2488810 RepID=A0A4U7JHY9_9FIRM|nr:hypothetical protein EHE19_004300 [Ruminiclostridium herbifermentans]
MGKYNKTLAGNPTSFSITSDAFTIGNGEYQAETNAFRVTFDGKTYGLSAFNSTGADYAEFFEWADGNIDNEDRVGYFVTLDGDKIRKAKSSDDYILGVVSVNPSVIGDNYADDWRGKYVTDNGDVFSAIMSLYLLHIELYIMMLSMKRILIGF